MTRYVVVGAGAIGGALGGRLVQHGKAAVLVARGEHQQALAEHGLRLRTPTEEVQLPVHAPAAPEDLRLTRDDVLVMATKTHQLEPALAEWAGRPVHDGPAAAAPVVGVAGDLVPVCIALNGVAGETMALRHFARVYGVCVWSPAVHLAPGEVIVRATPLSGILHVGRVPATVTDENDREWLARVADDWTAATFRTELPEDVMRWKYNKLLQNLGNIVTALLGPADGSHVAEAARAEGREVLAAAGIDHVPDEEERAHREGTFTVVDVPGTPPGLGGSTWQSMTRGTGNLETDYLNGEISLLAHGLGRRAPVNTALTRLARRAATQGWRPGRLTEPELADMVRASADHAEGDPRMRTDPR